jgi:succinoglycan biosynthesis protein ExoA
MIGRASSAAGPMRAAVRAWRGPVAARRSSPVDVSVLVPIRNEAAVIRQTARKIVDQRFSGSAEFLMIDGASDDGTRPILEQLAAEDERVRLIDNPAGDLASALNVGLEAARGEFVVKMDAHTYFPPDYVQIGVDRMRRGDVGWVSGPQIPLGVNPWSRRVALALGSRLGVGGSGKWAGTFGGDGEDAEKELDTGVFSGVWRRSTLEQLGGWEPDWPVNEDSELASRYLAAGERLVCVASMGAHYVPRGSLRGLARQYSRYGFYRAKTARRHPASVRPYQLAPAGLVCVVIVALLGPRSLRRLAWASLVPYAAAQALESARVAGEAERADAALLPAVFTTMHMSYGTGYLAGALRFGVPLAALGRRLAARLGISAGA